MTSTSEKLETIHAVSADLEAVFTWNYERSRPALTRVTSYQIVDNMTHIHSRHYLKFGFDLRRSYSNNYNPTNASGEFSFGPLQTGISTTGASGHALPATCWARAPASNCSRGFLRI